MNFVNANMISYEPTNFLSYDDVLMLPKPSTLTSRNDPKISLQTKFTSNLWLQNPIISANMDTVTDVEMVKAMYGLGCYGILHRFYKSEEEYLNAIRQVYEATKSVAFSIGANAADVKFVETMFNTIGTKDVIVCVDIAHGHLRKCVDQIVRLRKQFGAGLQIIAGNVATGGGAVDLISAGANAIKVGVGNGSMCTTRLVTGHGVPQLSAIMQCRRAINATRTNTALIADGGIRRAGDIVKALAAGADTVMVGNLLAGTTEAPGKLYYRDDRLNVINGECDLDLYNPFPGITLVKKYRGQSSQNFMEDIGKENVAAEGEHDYIPYRGSVVPIVKELLQGVRSGMTYAGVSTIESLSENATFIEISNHGYVESTPHGKKYN